MSPTQAWWFPREACKRRTARIGLFDTGRMPPMGRTRLGVAHCTEFLIECLGRSFSSEDHRAGLSGSVLTSIPRLRKFVCTFVSPTPGLYSSATSQASTR
jgi:hypothetical protein